MSIDANCARCGRPADKWSSNVPECSPCWYRRKLDLPAAQHWAKVAAEFLSNVDMYDLMTYLPACGLSEDEMRTMLHAARKVLEHSEAVKSPDYGKPAAAEPAHASEADINAALAAGEAAARDDEGPAAG